MKVDSLSNASLQEHFLSLSIHGRKVAFPCDAEGCVEIDSLSDAGRLDYLYSRIVMRHERVRPQVLPLPTAAR